MKTIIAVVALLFLSTSCKDNILFRATLFNPTSHDIKILFYKGGVVQPNDTVFLSPNAEFLLAYSSSGRGAKVGRGFDSGYFGGPEDSIVVVFDSQYSITHYADSPANLNKHYYLFDSLRNIANPYSYVFTVIHDNGTVNDHKYYFTEQDYLDAKD